MKARINLTPELQRKALEMARTQLRLESCFATQAMVLLAALTLAEEFGFGRERIERFCAKMQETLFRFEERHGDDWPDAAMNAISVTVRIPMQTSPGVMLLVSPVAPMTP